MPIINIEVLQDIWGGSEDADARITATVNKARVDAYRVSNQFIVFPRDLVTPVVNGLPTRPFILLPLPIGYYWHVDVFVNGEAPLRRTVIVPEGEGPFNFEDLIDVDPDSAQPDSSQDLYRAWLDQLEALIASVHGIPAGGSTGQVLAKVNNSDYNVQWVDQTGGNGGSGNNALIKSGHWNYPSINGVAIQPTADGESIALKSSNSAALRWHIRDGGPSLANYAPSIISINNPGTDGNIVTFNISEQEVAPPVGYHYGVSIDTGDTQYSGRYISTASTTTTLTLDYVVSTDSYNRDGVTGYITLPSVYNQVEARQDGIWIKNANWSEDPTFTNYWQFKTDGSISFPTRPSNARAGYGEILQFGNNSSQSIITGPPAQDGSAAQRIVVQGQNGSSTGGEGGDVYLWAGSGVANNATGGDIKVDAGQGTGTGEGGTVKIRGGYTPSGTGGSIEITSGYSTEGTGGSVHINASGGGVTGGDIQLNTFNQVQGQRSWTFNDNGHITFPDGTVQPTAYVPGGQFVALPEFLTYTTGRDALPDLNTNFGWDSSGVWFGPTFADGPSNPSYPIFSNFTLSETDKVVISFDVDITDGCTDAGVCVYLDGQVPNWAWFPDASRIAAQFNCPNPQLIGQTGIAEADNDEIPANALYRIVFTYDPTAEVEKVVFQYLDVATSTELTRLTLNEALPTGAYRIGFASDTDPGDGPNSTPADRAYISNLNISVNNGATTYTDTLQEGYSGDQLLNTGDITFSGVKIIGAGTASGDGNENSTMELVPDLGLYSNNQYLIIDPTAPNHIHVRAGGTQDSSYADLILGGEVNHVVVSDQGGSVTINGANGEYIGDPYNADNQIATIGQLNSAVSYLPIRYTPAFTATGLTYTGSGTSHPCYNSYYVKVGSMVTFYIEADLTTVTSFGTGQLNFELPFMPHGGMMNHFTGWINVDPSVNPDNAGHVILNADHLVGTKTLDMHYIKQSGGANSPIMEAMLTQGHPVTLTTTSKIYVNGTYITSE